MFHVNSTFLAVFLTASFLRLSPAASSLCGATTQINITEAGLLPCSIDNMRPSSEFITRLYCDNYVLCEGNKFKVSYGVSPFIFN